MIVWALIPSIIVNSYGAMKIDENDLREDSAHEA